MGNAANSAVSNPVWLTRLHLTQYRNYSSLSLPLQAGHVILTGENGSGKTNLLEAISYLSPGRGLRRASYDLVAQNAGDGTWAINATVNSQHGDVSIGTGISHGGIDVETNRKIRINQTPAKNSDRLLEYSRIVWLTPAMDGLFTGPKSDRRRFLDRMVLAIDPAHGRRVTNFEKSMRSRNKLLDENNFDATWLEGIETQMAELGIAICSARLELMSLLANKGGGKVVENSAFPWAAMHIEGELEQRLLRDDALEAEDFYRGELATTRNRDKRAGRTLCGPHRSDLAIRHGPKDIVAAQCSTGEQKALLVGLVLAHAELVGEVSGLAPILLLDEIAAHFDVLRREALFELIDTISAQAWMTGTEQSMFEPLVGKAQLFQVSAGQVEMI